MVQCRTASSFWPGATALRDALRRFDSGRLVVNLVDMPIKCPVAPLEFCFLADWYLRERGVRDQRRAALRHVARRRRSPSPSPPPHLAGLLAAQGHRDSRPSSPPARSTAPAAAWSSCDEREVPFDLLVDRPAARRSRVRRPLARAGRRARLRADRPGTPCSRPWRRERVRDRRRDERADLEGRLRDPLRRRDARPRTSRRFLAGEPLEATFDGHANCFIETGFGKALLIDFNYDHEPLPGRFPEPHLGPLPLLQRVAPETTSAKLMFQWVYWHMLLPGRAMPGISARMRPRPASRA